MDKFCAEYLRRSAHQVLTSAGFEKSSRIAGEVFADVLKDYLLCLGKSTHERATNTGRIKVTSTDVLATFEELGINIEELKDWASSEGKILGKFLGPQPHILKDLLRRGLPGYPADNNMSNNNNNDNNKSSSIIEINQDDIKLDNNIVDETLSNNNSIEMIETTINVINVNSSENNNDDNDKDHQDIPGTQETEEMPDQIMDQRPPTCDQFVNLYKSISHSEPMLHDSIESPKKKFGDNNKSEMKSESKLASSQEKKKCGGGGSVSDTKNNKSKKSTSTSVNKSASKSKKSAQSGGTPTVLKLRLGGTSSTAPTTTTPTITTNNNNTSSCQVWYHGTCVGFGPTPVEVNTWYCDRCIEKGVTS
ncbi:1674_t:CDS:2 [Diversispora eburnea]|uniref:1674_t:CDS:1 n=1 Tax=Diversispora eburnea TaxID=1213867 RepID=A0A9N8Z6D2_9GLOM|nr:1674_t:CDS:2 [Diversispora eburnea]